MKVGHIDYIIKSNNELPYLKMMLWSLKTWNQDMWDRAHIYVFALADDGTKEWCDENGIWCKRVDLPGLYSVWNYGASITQSDWLVFSASDFFLYIDFWKNIFDKIEEGHNFYHWTGTCVDNGISYPHPDIPQRRWFNFDCGDNWKEFDPVKFDLVANKLNKDTNISANETQYCPFICSREHYNRLGGFNTALGEYPTDIDHDFVRRGKEIERECCIVNNSVFYHFGKKSLLRRDGLSYDWKDIASIDDINIIKQ